MKKEELENYKPKGQLEGFPKEIINRMLDCQEEQGNKRDVSVFEKYKDSAKSEGGFDWDKTKEKDVFWKEIIIKENFNLFFERYPKQDNQYNSQEFNLENYVPKGQLTGFPKEIIAKMLDYQEKQGYPRDVSVFEEKIYAGMDQNGFGWKRTKDGLAFWEQVILQRDFNLFFEKYPKQGVCSECKECRKQEYQESKTAKYVQVGDNDILSDITSTQSSVEIEINTNEEDSQKFRVGDRWRAERNRLYYFINFYTKDWFFSDETKDCYDPIDNENYNSGNYFRTEVEAEIIAQKLNTYLKQLIKEEHEKEKK